MENTTLKYRIIDVQWHIGHQYEMLKFPFATWSWLKQYQRLVLDTSKRGEIRKCFREVLYYEPGEHDVAILHLDQECFGPRAWHRGKGSVYRQMNSVIQDIPKIVIMHGSPYWPEGPPPFNTPEYLIDRLHDAVGFNYVVVNSRQAATQWKAGIPIIHGMDQDEWFDLPKVPRVVTVLSPAGMNSYYDREFLRLVREALDAKDIVHCHIGVDYIPNDWLDYRRMLGGSLIYFNPTLASPMPRSRTEAMLSGCCVVTTPHHDADTFIQNGIHGYLVERDAQGVADLIECLLHEPQHTIEVGARGKQTAQNLFCWSRFAS
jgi:hypothetical protein